MYVGAQVMRGILEGSAWITYNFLSFKTMLVSCVVELLRSRVKRFCCAWAMASMGLDSWLAGIHARRRVLGSWPQMETGQHPKMEWQYLASKNNQGSKYEAYDVQVQYEIWWATTSAWHDTPTYPYDFLFPQWFRFTKPGGCEEMWIDFEHMIEMNAQTRFERKVRFGQRADPPSQP